MIARISLGSLRDELRVCIALDDFVAGLVVGTMLFLNWFDNRAERRKAR